MKRWADVPLVINAIFGIELKLRSPQATDPAGGDPQHRNLKLKLKQRLKLKRRIRQRPMRKEKLRQKLRLDT